MISVLWSDVLAIDIDTERFIAITGIVMVFALYARTRLVSGGTITPAYFLILILNGRISAVFVTLIVAGVTLILVRYFLLRRYALSKVWLSGSLIIVGSVLNGLVGLAANRVGDPFFGIEQLILVIGLFVTPGLIAYDWERQGFWKTNLAIGIVSVATLVLTTPVLFFAKQLLPGTSAVVIEGVGRIPDNLWWLASILAITSTLLLRFGLNWRSAGFIGGVFVFEALIPSTFLLAVVFSLATLGIVSFIARVSLLTPRQRFQLSLVVGALASWFGLFWFTRLGFEPAIIANGFALEPLLIVGLMASDMGRSSSSVPTTVLGTLASALIVGGGILLAETGTIGVGVATAAALASVAGALSIGIRRLRADSANAVLVGRETRVAFENSAISRLGSQPQ